MPDMELYLGDCVQVMRDRIPDESIDLTVTSPPYDNLRTYNGYVFDFEATARELWRVTKPGGVVVWVVADQTVDGSETGTSFRQALGFMAIGFRLHDTMIWNRRGAFPESNRYHPYFEYMFIFSKGKPKTFNPIRDAKSNSIGRLCSSRMERQSNGDIRRPNRFFVVKDMSVRPNIWEINAGFGTSTQDREAFNHPAIFPEALARDHILSWSNPGDLVLDPFVGSGTTGKMAKLLHRNFIGIDISEEYCNIAAKRIAETQSPAITDEGVFVQPEQAPLFEVA